MKRNCTNKMNKAINILTSTVIITCRNTTPKKANFLKRSFWIYLCNTNIVNNCVLAKCRGSHEMIDRFSIYREPTLAVIHHYSCTSSNTDLATEVCFPWFTEFAFSTFCLITRDDMVSRLNFSHAFTNTLYNPASN